MLVCNIVPLPSCSTYAAMLASQGNLNTAFNYLQENGAKVSTVEARVQ